MKINDIDIEKLKNLAEKAAPGSWRNFFGLSNSVETGRTLIDTDNTIDTDYITAASPDVVLELIAENKNLHANNYGPDILNDPHALIVSYFAGAMAEGRRLNDRIDQLEKEADWLVERCAKACIHKVEKCAFQAAWFIDKPNYGAHLFSQ